MAKRPRNPKPDIVPSAAFTLPAAPALPDPQGAPVSPAAALLPRGAWRWLAWALSLWPPVGLCLGLLFAGNPDREARRFGRICLVLAVLGILLQLVLSAFDGGMSRLDDADRWIETFE
jgi:hypothetical protein